MRKVMAFYCFFVQSNFQTTKPGKFSVWISDIADSTNLRAIALDALSFSPKRHQSDVKKYADVQCLQGAEVLLSLFVLFGDRIFFERVFDLRTEVCVKLLSASKDVSHGGRMFYKVPVWQCHCFKEWCGAFLSVCRQARA